MVIVAYGTDADTSLSGVLREIARRRQHLLPAFLLCFLMLLTLSGIQDLVRGPAYRTIRWFGADTAAGAILFFLFVVSFAACRLSMLVFIFAVALRRSYRRIG